MVCDWEGMLMREEAKKENPIFVEIRSIREVPIDFEYPNCGMILDGTGQWQRTYRYGDGVYRDDVSRNPEKYELVLRKNIKSGKSFGLIYWEVQHKAT